MRPPQAPVPLLLLLLATGCSAPEGASAQQPTASRRDFEQVVRDSKILEQAPGVAVGVLLNDEPVLLKGFGVANLELNSPATEHSVFQIGSLTKPFTSMMVMKLVEEGKLKLDDPLTKFFPDFPAYCKSVTLKHMMNHTSGIPNYLGVPGFMKKEMAGIEAEDVLAIVKTSPPNFKPGDKWDYSNTNYWLLGLIIAEVQGSFYADALKTRITDKAGMENSGFFMHTRVLEGRVSGYNKGQNGQWLNARLPVMTGPFAAGGMSTSAADMLEFDKALSANSLISEASLKQMLEPTKLSNGESRAYGFGWSSGVYRGEKFMDGGGGVPGFVSGYRRFLDKKLSIVVLANSNGASAAGLLDRLSEAVTEAEDR
jgi:D-alanyl-D-alanine carboxypeptidase